MLRQACATILLWGTALASQAHEGHGLPGSSHWHASDSLLWLGALAVGLAAWWFSRRR